MRKVVCVQGLGFVGAAMATAIALAKDQKGEPIYQVFGVDLENNNGISRVNSINEGKFPFETTDHELEKALKNVNLRGNLTATTNSEVYAQADIVIVDVHLDIPFRDNEPKLEFDAFKEALGIVANNIRAEALVIIETTVPPGTCEKIIVPLFSKIFNERGIDPSRLLLAHSYERVMPGKEYLNSIINFWRVFSGYTEKAADLCEEFLSSVINVRDFPLTRLGSTTASETAKVLENTYRTINIAFINEWSRFAEEVGIDLFEVISAIQNRPTHANIRFPGLGIGGYCLTKDPTFAPAAARELFGLSIDFPFSRLAISQSAKMPLHAVKKLKDALDDNLSDRKILLCGVSYRQDVADTRFSPSEILYRSLTDEGAKVDTHDPLVRWWDELKFAVPSELPPFENYDAVVFAVPHSQYQSLDLTQYLVKLKKTYFLDAFMVFSSTKRNAFREKGINIQAIGAGDLV